MKKQKVSFSPKLFLSKKTIAELNNDHSNAILGGADTVPDWNSKSPCGPCNASLNGGCPTRQFSVCPTINNANGVCCVVTVVP